MIGDALHVDKELMVMNHSIPVNRRTVIDYIENGNYTFVTRDGHICDISQDEVELIHSNCKLAESLRVRLPIIVHTETSGDCTAWAVDGAADAAVVARILGKALHNPEMLRFYNPDLKKLRDLLPTCTFMAFLP